MNDWDRQINELKRKHELKIKPEKEILLGRCSCGCGRFKHKMQNGKLIRICHNCKSEKKF